LKLDGLEEVALLGLVGVLEELLDVATHSGWRRVSSVLFEGWKRMDLG
jgi:hypothetical protein